MRGERGGVPDSYPRSAQCQSRRIRLGAGAGCVALPHPTTGRRPSPAFLPAAPGSETTES